MRSTLLRSAAHRLSASGRGVLVPSVRIIHSGAGGVGQLSIGDVSVAVRRAERPHLVGVANATLLPAGADSPETLSTLQWLMKKQLMGQDRRAVGWSTRPAGDERVERRRPRA